MAKTATRGRSKKIGFSLAAVGVLCAVAALFAGHLAGLQIGSVGLQTPSAIPEPLIPYYMDLLLARFYPLYGVYLLLRAAAYLCFLGTIIVVVRSRVKIQGFTRQTK